VDGGGVRYDALTDRFRESLRLWLVDAEAGGAEYDLAEPVAVGVFAHADSIGFAMAPLGGMYGIKPGGAIPNNPIPGA
jgi:hypothetical protein